MSPDQQQDLLVEWNLYESRQKKAILSEYRKTHSGKSERIDLLRFLKKKLEIEGYWEKIGLN
jgi:hypothetical protein